MSFTVYKSSAGSGKTTALVREYIKLILPDPSVFSQILAISFTNKASNEMKIRIMRDMERLSLIEDVCDEEKTDKVVPGLSDALKSYGFAEFSEIPRRAEVALAYILHHYSDIAVSTIDSFVHRIVRFFASDLYLSHDFEVELEQDVLIKKSVNTLIDRAGSDKLLTDFLIEYSLSLTDEEKNWNIEGELSKFAKVLFNENAQMKLPALRLVSLQDFVFFRKKTVEYCRNFENTLFSYGSEAMAVISNNNLDVSDFYQKKSGVAGVFLKLKQHKMISSIGSKACKTMDEDVWYVNTTDAYIKDKIDSVKNELRVLLNKIHTLLISPEFKKYNFYLIISGFLYKIALLSEIENVFEELREEDNIVHISEFNKRIANIVLKEPVPYIYERLGSSYKHFLIDEFQDTSVLQWINLLPLIENSLAEGKFNMIVGDGKQAIYRWRNGDVEQFASLPNIKGSDNDNILKQRETVLKMHYLEKPLDRNFRSGREIIEFNNRLFEHLSSFLPDEFKSIYKDVKQYASPEKEGGRIEIEFIPYDTKVSELKDIQKQRIFDKIKESESDKFNPRDIAVLVRDNKNASEIAAFLLEKGVPVVSAESLLLKNSAEVRFLVNISRFLNEPYNKVAGCAAYDFLLKTGRIKKDYPFENGNLFDSCNLTLSAFSRILHDNGYNISFSVIKSMPVYDMFEELFRVFKLGDIPDPFIQSFFENILECSSTGKNDLQNILEQWDEQKDSLSIELPEEMDAVRIMTIHKAKGLEFPVVIYPYFNEGFGKQDYLWVDFEDDLLKGMKTAVLPANKELANTEFESYYNIEKERKFLDMLNLLYVVLTRAGRRLYISGAESKKGKEAPDIINNIPSMLRSFLEKEKVYKESEMYYSFGDKGFPDNYKRLEEKTNLSAGVVISSPWPSRVKISFSNTSTGVINETAEWGTLVHKALSEFSFTSDVDVFVSNILQASSAGKETEHKLKLLLNNFINNKKIQSLLLEGDRVLIEQEIVDSYGIIHRPDRIVINGNNVTVIDFKTGSPSAKNREQVEIYAGLLTKMGYLNVNKCLVYVKESSLEIIEW